MRPIARFKCTGCHSIVGYRVMNRDRNSVVRCGACRLTHLLPRPKSYQQDLKQLRSVHDYKAAVAALKTGMAFHHALLLRHLSSIIPPPGRLLEIGAAAGDFLVQAQTTGYEVAGIEPARSIKGLIPPAIAKAIITLAKNLGLRVIAEGVESGKQLAFLVDQRCEEYQGYLFSRPMLADQIEPLLRANLGN